jgi:MFS family permease
LEGLNKNNFLIMVHAGRKERGIFYTKVGKLAVVLFVVAVSLAFIDTIWSVYIGSFFSDNLKSISIVGFITALFTIVSFFSFFFTIPILEKLSKSKIYLFSLLLLGICLLLLSFNKNFFLFLIIGVIIMIVSTLRITSFGIMVRDNSTKKKLTKNEGFMYTFMNIAWMIGPLIAGFFSEKYGTSGVLFIASIIIFIGFGIFSFLKIKDVNIKKKIDKNVLRNFFDFFKNKNRVIAYILGGGINFWWSLIYVFMPLYIIQNNFPTKTVGYFFFFVTIPLIALDYFVGEITAKIGFKKIFKLGFLIPALIALACFFVSNPYIIMTLLVLASLGLVMTEATAESYFFEVIKKEDECRFYGPYNTTIDLNHFISRILAAAILWFLPFKFIFLFFSFAMFVFFFFSFKTKNIIPSGRKK